VAAVIDRRVGFGVSAGVVVAAHRGQETVRAVLIGGDPDLGRQVVSAQRTQSSALLSARPGAERTFRSAEPEEYVDPPLTCCAHGTSAGD
jgi:hypothetical protein